MSGTPAMAGEGGSQDGGFTMIEMVVAISLIGTMMTSLALFYLQNAGVTRRQSEVQAAVQIAGTGMERVSQLPGDALLQGRTQAAVLAQWRAPGVAAYLDPAETQLVWEDPGATATPSAESLPTSVETVTVNGAASKFRRSWYVGACWQPRGSGNCTAATPSQQPQLIPMYRVIVAVTWTSNRCAASTCSFVSDALVGRTVDDPLFTT